MSLGKDGKENVPREQGLVRAGEVVEGDLGPDYLIADPHADKIDVLERQVARLRGDLSDARHELVRVREDTNRALTALRQQLSPLYRALQRVFGELDDAGIPDVGPSSGPVGGVPVTASVGPDPQIRAVWESWKSRLPPACGKIIDALLLHGDMSNAQLKVACHLGTSTVGDAVSRLYKTGLVDKRGGRISLKAL